MSFQFGGSQDFSFSASAEAAALRRVAELEASNRELEVNNRKLEANNRRLDKTLKEAIQRLNNPKESSWRNLFLFRQWVERQIAAMARDSRALENDYEQLREWQETAAEHEGKVRKLEAESRQLHKDLEAKEAQIKARDSQLLELQKSRDLLQNRVKEQDEQLFAKEHANDELNKTLDKLHIDIADLERGKSDALKEKNNIEAEVRELSEQLKSLQQEWDEGQDKLAELESAKAEMPQVYHQMEELEKDVDDLRQHISEKDQQIAVKDRLIADKETQIQKQMSENLRILGEKDHEILIKDRRQQETEAQLHKQMADKVAAADGDANVLSSSLEDEMNEVGEEFDDEEYMVMQPLEESGILTILDQAPVAPVVPALEGSGIFTTLDFTPVEPVIPELSQSGILMTETEPSPPTPVKFTRPEIIIQETKPIQPATQMLSLTKNILSTSTNPDHPKPTKLSLSLIKAVATNPEDATSPPVQPAPVRSALDEAPVSTIPTHTITMKDKMAGWFQTALPYLFILLVIWFAWVYAKLKAWEDANYMPSRRELYGAYGTPRKFLHIIPIGYEEGFFNKWGTILIQRLERWADPTPGFPY